MCVCACVCEGGSVYVYMCEGGSVYVYVCVRRERDMRYMCARVYDVYVWY